MSIKRNAECGARFSVPRRDSSRRVAWICDFPPQQAKPCGLEEIALAKSEGIPCGRWCVRVALESRLTLESRPILRIRGMQGVK